MTSRIEPQAVVDLVEEYVRKELSDAEKYENRDLLDESGIYSLHSLAADAYAKGYEDATRAVERREDGIRRRWQERYLRDEGNRHD